MSYRFQLQVISVECVHEQMMEWGKDEMRLFGFGIGRKGQLFETGYRSLGSYHEGDTGTAPVIPMILYDGELPDDGLDVLFYFWLVEEDGGGVRKAAAQLQAEFRASYFAKATALQEIQFPRDCIPFTAFYKAIIPFEDSIQEAATDGRNDEVYFPAELLLRFTPDGPTALGGSGVWTVRRSKRLGEYLVTLRYSYDRITEVLIQ